MPSTLDMNALGDRPTDPKFKIYTGALKAFEQDGRKLLSCTASSSVEDLHGDTMTDDCVRDMAAQAKAKNLTIFLNHKYAVPEDVFGSTVDTRTVSRASDDNGVAIWDFDLDMEVNDANPRALNTFTALQPTETRRGVKLGVSIGAMITDWEYQDEKAGWAGGLRIKKVDLLEASIVGIPANPRSWVQNAAAAIKSAHGIDEDGEPVIQAGELLVAEPAPINITLTAPDAGETVTVTTEPKTAEGEPTDPADDQAPEPDASLEGTDDSQATDKAEDTTPPDVDLDAAKAAADDLETANDTATTKALILQLVATAQAAYEQRDAAIAERDAARAEVSKKDAMLADAAEIVATIASLPLGRKTAFAAPVKTFQSRFGEIYDREFLRMIER